MKLADIYNLSDKIQGQKMNRGAMTDSAVERKVTPGTKATLMRSKPTEQAKSRTPRGTRCYGKYGWRTGQKMGR